MEYTDAPIAETTTGEVATITCPVCGNTLPREATQCDRCDWIRPEKPESAEGTASDAIAVLMSVVPGLGHIYKGHRWFGLLFMIGSLLALAVAALAATATAGFGLGLAVFYWLAVMCHAYAIDDRVQPGSASEGEQF